MLLNLYTTKIDRISELLIDLLESLNILSRWQTKEGNTKRCLVKPVLVEVECNDLTCSLLINAFIDD